MAMHRADRGHLQQEPWQGIQEVVVKEKGVQGATEDEGVRDGAHLELVVCESQVFQFLHAPHVTWQLVQAVVLQGQEAHVGTHEQL